MSTISFNPSATTSPQGTFAAQTQGYIQGMFLPDATARNQLLSGIVNSTVTQPVWGGMALEEIVNAAGSNLAGNTLDLAAANANVTGFSVFNRAPNMIVSSGNSVPVSGSGMTLNYFRLGSNARIVVLCTSALITAVVSNGTNTQVSWDFTNQQLIPYSVGIGALPVKVLGVDSNSKVVTYSGGVATWSQPGNVAIIQI